MDFNKTMIVSAAVGVMLAGVIFWIVNKLPAGNVVTDSIKKAKAVAATS